MNIAKVSLTVVLLLSLLAWGCRGENAGQTTCDSAGRPALSPEVEIHSVGPGERVEVPFRGAPGRAGTVLGAPQDSATYRIWIEWDDGGSVDVPCEDVFNVRECGVVELYGEDDEAVVLISSDAGSGFSTTYLTVINPGAAEAVVLVLTQSHESTKPLTDVRTSANFDDSRFAAERAFLESFKHKYGYLDEEAIRRDADNMTYAPYFWAQANGDVTDGPMTIRRLPGRHPEGASVNDQLADGDVVYTAFFKGAVWAYDKDADESFVVFRPDFYYCWPTELRKAGNWLLINTRGEGLFLVDTTTWWLKRTGVHVDEVTAFTVSNGMARVNDSFAVSLPASR